MLKSLLRVVKRPSCRFSQNVANKSRLVTQKLTKSFFPPIMEHDLPSIKSVVSIDTHQDGISLVHVNRDGKIVGWKECRLDSENSTSFDFEFAYNKVREICDAYIPGSASVYVFESREYRPRNLKLVPSMMSMQRNEVLIKTIIRSKFSRRIDAPYQRIHTVDAIKTARMFKLLVDGEKITSSYLVEQFVTSWPEDSPSIDDAVQSMIGYKLDAPDKFNSFYLDLANKESMSKAYLQAAFCVNVLKECTPRTLDDNNVERRSRFARSIKQF